MKRFFITTYNYLAQHKSLMWALMTISVVVMSIAAMQISLDENISSFFPSQSKETDFVMKNMKAMDKIIIAIEGEDDAIENMEEAAETLADTLQRTIGESVDITAYYDDETEEEMIGYVYSHLPYLMTDEDYAQFDSLTTDEAIANKMASNRELMMSPLSIGLTKILPNDPLGIAYGALEKLKTIKPDNNVYMMDGFMMADNKIIMFVELHDDFAKTGDNAKVVDTIREAAQTIGQQKCVNIYAYGAPIVAVSNSSRVKQDETITVSIALAITAIIILLTFKRKRAILLIILPVVYGGLFAFAAISLIGIKLSLISIGTGAMVLGLAMSYSIHMLTHSMHSESIRELMDEMVYPMTVGSITTIGAFVGLMFTDSKILQDLGLFASLALVGTLLYCLIFLPHFLVANAQQKKSATLRVIERIAGYDYAGNKWLVGVICMLTIVGLMFFTDVKFNADMNSLNYQGDEWIERSKTIVEKALTPEDTAHHATLVVTGSNYNELARNGEKLIDAVIGRDDISSYSSLTPWFLQSDSTRKVKLNKWQSYWTKEKTEHILNTIAIEAERNGFAPDAFNNFEQALKTDYCSITREDEEQPSVFGEYITEREGKLMLYVNLSMNNSSKDATMDELAQCEGTVVADMGYFVRKATSGIVDNFNFILLISSALVGLVLLLSYGRFELFAMTFLPMCISWVIILGLMALFDIEFNVVNIILSTFIFGVGDDFSIFIMDGLQSRYKGEKDMLVSHKTAIALSGIAVVIGLGVQVFAEHPACKSIGYLSIFGLVAVILTSYIVQPILFKLLISDPAKKGQPYTLRSIVRSLFYYGLFFVCCIVGYIVLGLLCIIPIKLKYKKTAAHYTIWMFMSFLYWLTGVSFKIIRIGRVDMDKPGVIIANHQSFIDIINVLSLSPKIVCITKSWVVNSPLFGPMTKFCDFYNADDGSEEMVEKMKQCIANGYSIVIFPEGTRSEDGEIHRFHKGAFLMAETLKVDITPMVIYGNNMIASKQQPLNLKDGWIVNKVLPRISFDELCRATYVEQSKRICQLMRKELEAIKAEYDIDENPYYREAILHKYVYKDLDEYRAVKQKIKTAEGLHQERLKLAESK